MISVFGKRDAAYREVREESKMDEMMDKGPTHLHCPYTGASANVEDMSRSVERREEQSTVPDQFEDMMLHV